MDDIFTTQVDLPVKELKGFDLVLEQTLSQPQYQNWKQIINSAGITTLSLLREIFSTQTELEYILPSIVESLIGAGIDTSFSNAEQLVKMPLKKRLSDQDSFSALITLSGQIEIIGKKAERILRTFTERELAFFKYFVIELNKRKIVLNGISKNFDELLKIAVIDSYPDGLSQENLPLLLKVYAPRRKEGDFYKIFQLSGEQQAEALLELISEGSRGLTKKNADISRDVMGHLGKLLQNLIYYQLWEGNIHKIPDELKVFAGAIAVIDSNSTMWEKFEGGKAITYFKALFDNAKDCIDAYRFTSEIMAWWVITKTLKPTLRDYGVNYNAENREALEIQKWLTEYAQIDISGIIAGFTRDSLSELINEVEYFLEGFKHDHRPFPDERETLVDNLPSEKMISGLVTNAIQEIVSGWLRSEHSNLTHSVTYSLMALTRVINADFINTLRKGTYFTEFPIPSEHDTNLRCDIVIIPEELDTEQPDWSDFKRADLLEIKLVQSLSVNPTRKFLDQIEMYIRKIRKVNPKIRIKPYLLEVSGMGIKLTDVSKYLSES